MKLGTEKRCDLFDTRFCQRGPRGNAWIEVVGLEWFATSFAVAVDFGGDPHQRAGQLPIVLSTGVDHPHHLTKR